MKEHLRILMRGAAAAIAFMLIVAALVVGIAFAFKEFPLVAGPIMVLILLGGFFYIVGLVIEDDV